MAMLLVAHNVMSWVHVVESAALLETQREAKVVGDLVGPLVTVVGDRVGPLVTAVGDRVGPLVVGVPVAGTGALVMGVIPVVGKFVTSGVGDVVC